MVTHAAEVKDIEQRANDMIAAITAQRNAALNAVVQLEAAIASKQRELDALKASIEGSREGSKMETLSRLTERPVANGHDGAPAQ